jgi:competence protein ComEA
MPSLTPAERRAALVVASLLLLGAARDLWRASHPVMAPPLEGPVAESPPLLDAGDGAARPDATPRSAGGTVDSPPGRELIDLNQADAAALDALPGVGPVLAERIVEQRRRQGPFRRLEDLRAVRGIGPRLIERIRGQVRIGAAAGEASR